MNNETTKLIEQLASKLGTTSEYLWGVLLKQAPISATIDLVQIICVFIFGAVLYRIHKHLSNRDNELNYADSDGGIEVVMAVSTLIWGILAIVGFFCLGDVVTGFLNPEYWALERILNALKHD